MRPSLSPPYSKHGGARARVDRIAKLAAAGLPTARRIVGAPTTSCLPSGLSRRPCLCRRPRRARGRLHRRDAFLTPPHPPHPARPKAGPRPAPATTEALCRDKRPVLALYSCSSLCTRTHSAQVGWLRYAPYPLVLLTPGSLMRVIFDPPPSPRRLADPSPLAVLPGGWRCCAQLWVLPCPSGPVAVSRGGRQPLGEARP
jgi:hypothetical protein